MAGWNYGSGLSHLHLSLCVLQCQPVSSMCWEVWLTVRFLSHDGLGQYCVVHFVPGQVCTQGSEWACAVLTWFLSATGVHFRCLHLLHAVLSPWTHEVWGGHMSMSHRMNPNIVRKVIPFSWDLIWHLDEQITAVQWQRLWSLLYLTYICFS